MRNILLVVFTFAALAAHADPPSCALTVSPVSTTLLRPVTVTLTVNGTVEYASINGQQVDVPRGSIVETPALVGEHAVKGFVSGPEGSANCYSSYTVVSRGEPVWLKNPIDLPLACYDLKYDQSLSRYVSSIGGEPLTFRASTSTPVWLKVSTDGRVLGVPGAQDVGNSMFEVEAVNSSGGASKVLVNVTVDRCNGATILPAVVGQVKTWELSLSGPGEWTKLSGPSWVQVTLNGTLTAIPGPEDIGDSQVIVAWRHDNIVERQIVVIQVSKK